MWTSIGKVTGTVQAAMTPLEGKFKNIHFALMGYMVVKRCAHADMTADDNILECLRWFDRFCWARDALVFDTILLDVINIYRAPTATSWGYQATPP